ncbi:glucose-6-phosphate isomerase [Pseudoteredinibacter isoporae]|uniref:Glucose-6-phosphate isomerase n=1 Tax=Pseudoteredinibacter isoporae TaxID=570281 RepID=A0A7X0JT63_9GAMM|nr:glucose-6-phosphate isomerase [Pseudoteredinibacter isoporae]MBB6520975.1 glucose-6-phosphate isomerase [Pseudoteredinibacter isoporae]NHO86540.1 glucose-6-phosphate isomerase [Pseudoteredinibacter isoporae]NIB25008.1 glucose-6-phosphate isomerase [Pseudoteredinibacter isoporae]
MNNISESSQWQALKALADQQRQQPIHQLFSENPKRFEQLSFRQGELLVDFSKQHFQRDTLEQLIALAEQCELPNWIRQLFEGAEVNHTENRPALHTALRLPEGKECWLEGKNISIDVQQNLQRMDDLVHMIHSGQWRGCSGEAIDTVVNIGVGGSDLGPLMACNALAETPARDDSGRLAQQAAIDVHFVSSMDGSQLADLLKVLNPMRTLFVIASKSFTTIDTMANAATAKEWLNQNANCSETALVARHFIAVSSKPEKMLAWGIPKQNQLEFWEWTGGRYSMWSAIGLLIALKLGMSAFKTMLAGAHSMDEHFRQAPLEENIPALLALTGIWNINFLNIGAHAILPYDGRLKNLPAYLEQLEMESNGKSVNRQGETVDYNTCPILWGEIGTNAQHAFYQLLHQGTEAVMCDFIVAAKRYGPDASQELRHQHQLNLANCFAQSRILALGDSVLEDAQSAPAHKRYQGNQPCTTIMLNELSPFTFGQLIAMYEHKVFVQSVIWGINPFDQWGVELGKQVATNLLGQLDGHETDNLDASTAGLIQAINQ